MFKTGLSGFLGLAVDVILDVIAAIIIATVVVWALKLVAIVLPATVGTLFLIVIVLYVLVRFIEYFRA